MMRYLILTGVFLLFFSGCSSKSMTVSGMICPPGHDEQMVNSDFRACHAYDEKEAGLATFPKSLDSECKECLLKRGYTLDEDFSH